MRDSVSRMEDRVMCFKLPEGSHYLYQGAVGKDAFD